MALAYAREGKIDEAITYLEQAQQSSNIRISQKIQPILEKLIAAKKNGTKIKVHSKAEAEAPSSFESLGTKRILQKLTILPGELGLYQIYQPKYNFGITLNQTAPHFNPRVAIERGETGGAERARIARNK
jgi:hypothetical protein